ANSEQLSNEFFVNQDMFNDVHNGKFMGSIDANTVKNTSFIYAVPKEIKYVDNISRNIEYAKIQSYSMEASIFINCALIFIMICAILIPYKKLKELVGFNKISKIPFEVNLLLGGLAVVFLYGAPEISILRTINMNLEWFFDTTLSGFTIPNLAIGLLNLIYWVICFGIIFIEVVILKHILNKGIKKYAEESMVSYKVSKYIKNKVKRGYKNFKQIDFRAVNTNKLIKILLINFLILIVMCSMWFFGIILAIVYTIILFIKVRKYSTEISNQYNKLFEATNKIAEGNLDVTIEDDLGIFEPFKDEVEKIQSGFKKAVNEEVKSQRMKTELISNVSHDLKTPLTSIITYVDLLKDENLSEEKRAQYLDTLDRKSQRLQELIEDLFEVSKATSGSINLNLVEVDVVSLMKQTLLELDDKIEKSSLILKKNMPKEKVLLQLDSQRMFRVFENLIINITKYAMIGSRVYIDVIDNEECVEIILRNMTAEEINFNVNEIVERFVRGDKARNTEGSGLGLAIAKSFVELQGGEFEVNIDGDLFKVIMKFNK
ncbi:MAG: sensor histidine kinase, partial [Terrisporobacter sp.]